MLACGIDIDVVARHASAADNLAIRCRLDHRTRDLGGGANDIGLKAPTHSSSSFGDRPKRSSTS